MPKNYYIYEIKGKIKRQAINLNDIYPESYAINKIPAGADIFAKIITSDVKGKDYAGHMVKHLISTWQKCDMWTNFYPDNITIQYEDAVLFHIAQAEYVKKYLPLITESERESLKDSTDRVLNREWIQD